MLGILFTELGPLIFTAGILVTTNLLGGLSFLEDAFQPARLRTVQVVRQGADSIAQ